MHIHCSHTNCIFHRHIQMYLLLRQERTRTSQSCIGLLRPHGNAEICLTQQYYCSYLTYYFSLSFTVFKRPYLPFHTPENSSPKVIAAISCLRQI